MSQSATPPPLRRAQRPPRINIKNLNPNASMMGSMPPTAQPYTAQTINNMPGSIAGQPYWPNYANPFAAGNFMAKGFEGFVDFTKSGMSFGEKFTYGLYNKFSKWSRKWFTHMFLLFVITLYSVGGALLFRTIESREAKKNTIDIQYAQKQFFNAMIKVSKDSELLENRTTFGGRVTFVMRTHSAAVQSLLNSNLTLEEQEKQANPWTFWNAMFYCGTIYTTIGYGHITPKTNLGRALSIVYAIIGIPIFLIILADFGKLFTRGMKFLWAYVRRLYYTGTCRQIRKQQQVRDAMMGLTSVYDMAVRRPSHFFGMGPDSDIESQASDPNKSLGASHPDTPTSPYPETFEIDDEFNLPVTVASFLLISYILLGTIVYKIGENWSYFESFYFVFISMSTIGFGDFVPSNPIFMMCSIIYLVFGLALTSMFINVVQIKLSDTFKQASAKLGATIGLASEMGDLGEMGDEGGSQLKASTSELASVHGSRLGKIAEDENEVASNQMHPHPPLTSILRPTRPISPMSRDGNGSTVSEFSGGPPPLYAKKQVTTERAAPPAPEQEKKKKRRFF